MMRSFLYLFSPLTTTTIVATLSLAESLGEAGFGAHEFQPTIYTPSTDNSEANLLDDSPVLVGLDNDIQGWGLGKEEAQANNENGGACSGSKSINRKRRRGNEEKNYCSPMDAPAPASPSRQFRPHSQQGEGSDGAGTGGSSTTNTRADQKGGSGSSTQSQPGTEGINMFDLAPWSSAQNSCPENRPVAVCAGAKLLPYGPNPGWQWIPFSDIPPPPEELFYWPYCRLCSWGTRNKFRSESTEVYDVGVPIQWTFVYCGRRASDAFIDTKWGAGKPFLDRLSLILRYGKGKKLEVVVKQQGGELGGKQRGK